MEEGSCSANRELWWWNISLTKIPEYMNSMRKTFRKEISGIENLV